MAEIFSPNLIQIVNPQIQESQAQEKGRKLHKNISESNRLKLVIKRKFLKAATEKICYMGKNKECQQISH